MNKIPLLTPEQQEELDWKEKARGPLRSFLKQIAKSQDHHPVPSWREALALTTTPEQVTALLTASESLPMSPDTRRKFQRAARARILSL